MSPSNIFRRKKSSHSPKSKSPKVSKKTEAKRPTIELSSENKDTRKRTIRKKAVEKTVEQVELEKVEEVVTSIEETPIIAKKLNQEVSVPDEVQTPTPTVSEEQKPSEERETGAEESEKKNVPQEKAPSKEIKIVAKENRLEEKKESPSVKETPRVTAKIPVIRKKETMIIDNLPRKNSKLGKAVIAAPPGYNSRLRREASAKITPEVNTEVPTEKEDRRKKEKKTERFDRTDKQENKSPKKRTRTKLRTPKMEMKIEDVSYPSRRPKRKRGSKKKSSPKPRAEKRKVFMFEQISVGDLAHQLSVKSGEVIKKLLTFDVTATQDEMIDFETTTLVAELFEYEVINKVQSEDDFLIIEKEEEREEGDPRPAVVTIMGHVDHGKTTLLDSIRKANVAKGEAGGITQHISAYQVQKNGQLITFIDTPGHKAFTAMRSRGAKVTDIVILVVAADDGVMPQTEEALSHAQAAGVDIIVAINKCDKPNANPERVKQELMARELVPEEYGGDTIFVELSALKGMGIDDLLENIILLSEMKELKAPKDSHAQGTVLEARLDKGRGPVATIIIKKGTLNRGDSLVLGTVCGRVRAMTDHNGKNIKKALPSTPLEIIGLESVPNAGDDFTVVKNDKDARALASLRIDRQKQKEVSRPQKLTLEQLLMHQEQGELLTLNLILKTDVGGTLEAIKGTLDKINIEGTEIKILHSSVGAITEGDITLAHTYGGVVIGFNVRPDSQARKAVNRLNVDIKTYKLIHDLENDIQKALKGMLSPETEEKMQALAEVREIYHIKAGTIAGCMVLEGKLEKKHPVRLLRSGIVVWEGNLSSLRRHKDDAREVEKGFDCGLMLEGFGDIKPFDQIESYAMEEIEIE
jgi:translation initiation factor IF-2